MKTRNLVAIDSLALIGLAALEEQDPRERVSVGAARVVTSAQRDTMSGALHAGLAPGRGGGLGHEGGRGCGSPLAGGDGRGPPPAPR